MENIYSTLAYQELSEVPNVQPVAHNLFGDQGKQSFVFGLKQHEVDFYGIYAPFWFPLFLAQNSDIKKLEECLDQLLQKTFFNNDTKKIIIRLPPYFYDESIEILSFLLEKNGFKQSNIALWQMMDLKGYDSKLSYTMKLKHSARKVLKKFDPADICLERVDVCDTGDIKLVYDIINQNRINIGTNIKYSLNYLLSLISQFEAYIKIFLLKVKSRPVAAAICHQSSKNVMYVAGWGDSGHSLEYSPMYNFAAELVGYCIEKKYEYLDFGISSDLDLYTPNLLKFKQNIGCQTTSQRTFCLEINK